MTTYFLMDRKKHTEPLALEGTKSKLDYQESTVSGKIETQASTNSKQLNGHTSKEHRNENSGNCRGKMSQFHQPPVNEIMSTSSPRLPSMQLPPWHPKPEQSIIPENSSSLYNQPKPIIGNMPSKSYSQSRPRYTNTSSSSQATQLSPNGEGTTKSSNSMPELKEELLEKLQRLNTTISPYTSNVYRPSKLSTHPRSHPPIKSPALLTPPKELFQFPPPPSSPPNDDDESAVHSNAAMASDISIVASSSHESFLGLQQNNSIETSSFNQSSASSCDSFVKIDFSRTDADSPSPGFYDYASGIQWVYPVDENTNAKNSSKPNETSKQKYIRNSNYETQSDDKHILPEVGLSPSRLSKPSKKNNLDDIPSYCSPEEKFPRAMSSEKKTNVCIQNGNKQKKNYPNQEKPEEISTNVETHSESFDTKGLPDYFLKKNIKSPTDGPSTSKFVVERQGNECKNKSSYKQAASENVALLAGGNCQGSYNNSVLTHSIPLKDMKCADTYTDDIAESNMHHCRMDSLNSVKRKFMSENDSNSHKTKGNVIGLHFDPIEKKMTLSLLGSENTNPKNDETTYHDRDGIKSAKLSSHGGKYSHSYFKRGLIKAADSDISNSEKVCDRETMPLVARSTMTGLTDSDDSDDEDDEKSAEIPLIDEQGYCTDDPALENASLLNEQGLTDAEGALSDLNSIINDPGHDGDMDDTSISSRASSRMFDSDQLLSVDSLNLMYDSEYENYRPGMVSDDEMFHQEPSSDVDLDYLDDNNVENIRALSNNITRNFGLPKKEDNDDEQQDKE